MDAGLFRPMDEYTAAVDSSLAGIKAVPPAPGFQEVLLPGNPSCAARPNGGPRGSRCPTAPGITVKEMGAKLGVDVEALVG